MNRLYIVLLLAITACNFSEKSKNTPPLNSYSKLSTPKLNLDQAHQIISLPTDCINIEYPNKLNQIIGDENDLKTPKELHPAFYGCFDWHSSVHGHWSLVALLKQFPIIRNENLLKQKLLNNLSKENILKEVTYFQGKHNTSYERTYGWAWLLKLAEELHTWNDPVGKDLEKNLQPLTDLIVNRYIEFLPKLKYPVRTGEHENTAFGLAFAWDYANAVNNQKLKSLIEERAVYFYFQNTNCPLSWEPGGYDFLSPCLQEAALMKRILKKEGFRKWLIGFLPQLQDHNFTLPVGEILDRTDGKLVHLDGLNFSRAWALNEIIRDLPEYKHLQDIATNHVNHSLPNLIDDSYEGGHWLGTYAIYSLNSF